MNKTELTYTDFLKSKIRLAEREGVTLEATDINPALKPHNRLMVEWLVRGGKRACFASFGLHKTVTQLEAVRIVLQKVGGIGLIILPLNVKQEFQRDAINILGWEAPPKFIRRTEEAKEQGIYLTNYESVRDGKMDPRAFEAVSLDEASVLRGMGSTKTFREFMRLFTGDAGPTGNRRGKEGVKYRFVATATPSPNDYIELLAYADFLGQMDVSQAKTRFFKRDSTKADKLTLHPHKEEEFWLWIASWALFVSNPSDITRMLTLNSSQWSKGKEMHLCPLQFDIVDRVIAQMSNPGDVVLDYFSGIGTVPYRAVLKGRRGYGIELNHTYWLDGVHYCRAAEEKVKMPTLFDITEMAESA